MSHGGLKPQCELRFRFGFIVSKLVSSPNDERNLPASPGPIGVSLECFEEVPDKRIRLVVSLQTEGYASSFFDSAPQGNEFMTI